MTGLRKKTILVTGASSGIGLAVCRRIREEGGAVLGVARHKDRLKASFSGFRAPRHRFRAFDVTDFDGYPAFVESLPPLDGIVHAAGASPMIPARNLRKADLDQAMHVHLYAPILLTLDALRARKFNAAASVVFVSSKAALAAEKAQMPYALAKSTLLTAAKCLTAELSVRHNIRFNAVLPGLTDTGVMKEVSRFVGEERLREMIAAHPLGLGRPRDVAFLITFLLSDRSAWISGSSFVIDGGRLCVS